MTVHQQAPLTRLIPTPGGYTVETPGLALQARYLVGADGANSITRKLIGAPRFKRLAVALEWEIRSSAEHVRRWRNMAAVDPGSLRSGYGWMFPKSDSFSIGVAAPKSLATQLRRYCENLRRHYGDALEGIDPHIKAGHHLPIRVPREPVVFGRTLLVGDAAGLTDAAVGEGIYYAMRSGKLAADTIADARRHGDGRMAEYQMKIDNLIQPELQVSKSLLFLLDHAPAFWVPRMLKQSSWFWKYFYSIYTGDGAFCDLPKKLGPFGGLLYSTLARDDLKPYADLGR